MPGFIPLPDVVYLLTNSIGRAAIQALSKGQQLEEWVTAIERYVAQNRLFTKFEALYVTVSPPPFFWDYSCGKCRWWQEPDRCKVVEGQIGRYAWCAIWVPPQGVPPFQWSRDYLTSMPDRLREYAMGRLGVG